MLKVQGLQAFYGKSQVLHGLNFALGAGEIVALLGRNGSGRSSAAEALMGLVQARGSVLWQGQQLLGRKPYEIARLGLGYVPESRDVFAQLTVRQNLLLGVKGRARPGDWTLEQVYALFPRLQEREHTPAGVLSGGEQQMLSLCRTLMGNPQLLLVDEPTEGLAPQMVERIAQVLQQLRARGLSVLLIEQKLSLALTLADRLLVLGHGAIVFEGTPQALRAATALRQEWLEI